MPFDVKETTLPGIGKKYEVYLDKNRSVAILLETSGKREVFYREDPRDDYEKLLSLTDSQARTVGLFLVGAYYQPIAGELAEETAAGEFIEWYQIDADSPLAGKALGELGIETESGSTILGIERNGDVQSIPRDEFVFDPGDRIIAIGTEEAHAALETLLVDD